MARKHEKFSYGCSFKCALETWNFVWCGKRVNLEYDTKSTLAQLVLSGRKKEAEDRLKRLLRKQEKEPGYRCIGFFFENSRRYIYTPDLYFRTGADLQERFRLYKRFKEYIVQNGCIDPSAMTAGELKPDGKMCASENSSMHARINIKKPVTIHLAAPPEKRIFDFDI